MIERVASPLYMQFEIGRPAILNPLIPSQHRSNTSLMR